MKNIPGLSPLKRLPLPPHRGRGGGGGRGYEPPAILISAKANRCAAPSQQDNDSVCLCWHSMQLGFSECAGRPSKRQHVFHGMRIFSVGRRPVLLVPRRRCTECRPAALTACRVAAHCASLNLAGTPTTWSAAHSEILWYLSLHFASTLAVLPNLIVQQRQTSRCIFPAGKALEEASGCMVLCLLHNSCCHTTPKAG